MKIQVTFKTPDALEHAFPTVSDDEGEQAERKAEAMRFIEKYVENGKYVTLEFDTETETVMVLPA